METIQYKARHRRRGLRMAVGIPTAVVLAAGMAYGGAAGLFGEDAQPKASAAKASAARAATWASEVADGFASVTAMGQKGTYGGRDGETVTVKTLADLEKYATATKPYVIVVAAEITMNPKGKEIKVASDKTIVGSGTSGHIVGGGFFLGQGVHNVIIRNLTIRDSYQDRWSDKVDDFDAIQMDGAHHVWIDHNDLRHMADGLIDSRKDTTFLTVSWNRLQSHNKAFGIGWTPNTTADITIHHNWFHETEQRNPSADNVAHAHLYNNYLQDDPGTAITSSYGNYARGKTKMVLENSYFEGFRNPVIKDDTAALVQRGNVFVGTTGRNEHGGEAFDPKKYYKYTLDAAADVPARVKSGSGPQTMFGKPAGASAGAGAAVTLTVAKDGSARYTTVQAAVNAVPAGNTSRVVIMVAPGTYREHVKIPANKPFVTIQGSGPSRHDTVIISNASTGTPKPDGSGEYGTDCAAVIALADEFQARNLTITNDFDEGANQGKEGQQALALRTAADKVVLDSLILNGDQDTLLMDFAGEDKLSRVYLTNSYIVGSVDFIYGRATAVVDKSVITLKKRWNGASGGYILAPGTPPDRKGFLVINSTVNGDVSDGSFHLGRNWHGGGDASLRPQATVRNTYLPSAIKTTTPWSDMGGFSWKKDRFAEYKNTGPGAGSASGDRPQLTDAQAAGQEIADWLGNWTPSAS